MAIMEQPALIIFGPQTSWPSNASAARFRRDLVHEPSLAPFADAIRKIPELWTSLVEIEPRLARTEGRRNLEQLRDWLETGSLPRRDGPDEILPNGFATPFTVIAQSIEYWRCFPRGARYWLPSRSEIGPALEGMCTGFLTAIAAACSKDSTDFFSMAAVALRLAACIGTFIDLNETTSGVTGEARSLVVRWSSSIQESCLLRTLEEQPNAYVSVLKDETSRTITLPASEISSTAEKLLMNGLRVHVLELKGRFHHASNEELANKLIGMSKSRADLQFPDAQGLLIPLRRNSDGKRLYEGPLHIIAIRSLVLDQVDWLSTVTSAMESAAVKEEPPRILVLGSANVVPHCLIKRRGACVCVSNDKIPPVFKITNAVKNSVPEPDTTEAGVESLPDAPGRDNHDNSIAIVGMACRFPGADSAEEFWELLESGKSMLSVLPHNRFPTKGLRRSADDTVFWGNFIQDPDQFDNRFFQISSREAASMDPQQRLILQVAYKALESSGYFDGQRRPTNTNIGCYLGVGSVDYEANIYSHQPNSYSALGSLRAFISGRVSHYFGWTGPSITYDTACSSSIVALHSACKALLSGECTSALSGGVNVITSPALYQNLGAASFLSPTGATKAFDAAADGYSRGEGCGLFVLKRLENALADGDQVLGVIAGSAVNQAEREQGTSITVPVSKSQQSLYRKVLGQAGLGPSDVTYIEAHGTGTPRGDPIECESIRNVFGSNNTGRQQTLYFGSVKGNIGHLEAGSGAAALFKSVLMLQKKKIPKHVNFNKLNPQIPPLELEKMAIPTETISWDASIRAICISNYGAAGSNGALVLREAPEPPKTTCARPTENSPLRSQLISISAYSAESLQAYCDQLLRYLADVDERDFPDVAYKLARIQNPTHKYRLSLITRSISELRSSLAAQKHLAATPSFSATPKPVVLCFGGQSKSSIGISKELYRSTSLFRHHLDHVETACQALGKTIYPYIFLKEAIRDSATLHCCLFASQYACAKSWIDAGIKVATVIGHSFGQISALCVCGVLSLKDAVKYVIERASLFDIDWSATKGAMLALKADAQMVTRLVATSQAEIACYNGPREIVVAGSVPAIEGVQSQAKAAGIDVRRLDVARAFHSSLMDPAMPQLRRIANTLSFHWPQIPIQTCTQGQSWDSFSPQCLVDHSRQPVFFNDAVQRIESQFGPCTWIEAGSSSYVTTLASRSASQLNSFIPVDIGDPSPADSLANATLKLQGLGYNVQFWAHHRSQRDAFRVFNLPPYQFAKSKHWLEFKEFNGCEKESSHPDDQDQSSNLLRFIHMRDTEKGVAEFKVNSNSDDFRACVSGHAVLGHSLCPASLYIELAMRAAVHLCEDKPPVLPEVADLQISAPLGLDSSASIKLLLSLEEPRRWRFSLLSTTGAEDTHHASGAVQVTANADSLVSESSLYERLIGANRCNSILQDASIKSINGLVYNVFGAVVDYKDFYQGVQRISATESEASGVVSLPATSAGIMQDSVCDPLALDNFLQVSGIQINCFRDIGRQEVYVCTSIGRLKLYQSFDKARDQSWLVYSNTKQCGSKVLESDIFAFNQTTGTLTVALFGVRFAKVPMNSLTRALSTLNHGKPAQRLKDSTPPSPPLSDMALGTSPEAEPDGNILLRLQHLLSRVTDCSVEEVLRIDSLEALGIDSLMRSEVTAEIRQEFGLDMSTDTLANASTLFDLTTLISPSQIWPVPVDNTPSSSESNATLSMHDSTSSNFKNILSVITDIPVDEIDDNSTLDALGIDSLMRKEVQSELRKELGRADIPENLQEYSVTSLATYLADQDCGTAEVRTPSDNASLGSGFDARELDSSRKYTAPERIFKLDERPSQLTQIPSPPKALGSSNGVFELDELRASFEEIKGSFDKLSDESQLLNFYVEVYPRQMELVTAYVVEAFRSLGCPLSSMSPGESLSLSPVSHEPRHGQVMKQLYKMLQDAGLISLDNLREYKRTAKPVDSTSSAELLDAIIQDFPQHRLEHRLLGITGSRLAPCLSGELDALDLIFGDRTARDLVGEVYLKAPAFVTGTKLLCKFLLSILGKITQPVKILEVGAGTGGTTADVIHCLTSSNIPFEYCFSDLSPSLIAAARKKFKWCPNMEFTVLDIEQEPTLGNQYDLIISTNCIHATRNLTTTTKNIHKLLKEGGVLCLVELTRNLPWFDLVFGLLEGWWLFNDGREHALAHEHFWEDSLKQAGFSHVNWTTGDTKESEQLRLITGAKIGTLTSRRALPVYSSPERLEGIGLGGSVVLLTGGTGNLGTHVLHQLINRADVRQVICLNRLTTNNDPIQRQQRALRDRGIELSEQQWEKIEVLEAKSHNTALGLPNEQYLRLRDQVTHIIHNAWPMSFKRSLNAFEPQFKTLHNLLELCHESKNGARLLFISSIGVIGRHPNTFANKPVPEDPVRDCHSSLDFGYTQAKYHCEQIINRALEQDPSLQASYVRVGQITGSQHFGLWNTEEHVPALLRTSQTIGALPQLDGFASWLPLDIAAATVSELLLDSAHLRMAYHIENPVRQPWCELLGYLSAHLGLPIIPYKKWLGRMETNEDSVTGSSNPARNLREFFENDFLHMSCGSVVMSTTRTTSVSAALRSAEPVSSETLLLYLEQWRRAGFLG